MHVPVTNEVSDTAAVIRTDTRGEERSINSEPPSRRTAGDLARALGWLSIGLGIASVLMPRRLAQATGIATNDRWLRTIGAREIISGVGIVLQPRQPQWLWSRVAGDLMDAGLLAMVSRRQRVSHLGAVSAALAGIAVLDLLAALDQTGRHRGRAAGAQGELAARGLIRVKKSLDVNRSPEACYRFWRDIGQFPRFMQHVEAIEVIDPTRSRWQVRAPFGLSVQWEAELVRDVPGQQLGWRTLAGADIAHEGSVRFSPAPGQRGTRIEVDFRYHPPLGKVGAVLAKMTGEEPSQQLNEDLRRFKQLIETGEIPTTIGQPAGRRSALGRLLRQGAPG